MIKNAECCGNCRRYKSSRCRYHECKVNRVKVCPQFIRAVQKDQVAIGKEMRRLRHQRGLTIRELSYASGYSESYITQLENGQKTWTDDLKQTMQKAMESSRTPS